MGDERRNKIDAALLALVARELCCQLNPNANARQIFTCIGLGAKHAEAEAGGSNRSGYEKGDEVIE